MFVGGFFSNLKLLTLISFYINFFLFWVKNIDINNRDVHTCEDDLRAKIPTQAFQKHWKLLEKKQQKGGAFDKDQKFPTFVRGCHSPWWICLLLTYSFNILRCLAYVNKHLIQISDAFFGNSQSITIAVIIVRDFLALYPTEKLNRY